jgi:hypothetical protein
MDDGQTLNLPVNLLKNKYLIVESKLSTKFPNMKKLINIFNWKATIAL